MVGMSKMEQDEPKVRQQTLLGLELALGLMLLAYAALRWWSILPATLLLG